MRPFNWGTAWSFISKDIRIITSQNQKFQESALLSSKFKSVRVWPLVFQVLIDEKFHAIPQLKALINGIYTSSGPRGCTSYVKTVRLGKNLILVHKTWFAPIFILASVQSLAIKLAFSISVIRKLAVVFIPVEIQKFVWYMVWKTWKFAISVNIKTFKILKVTRILG